MKVRAKLRLAIMVLTILVPAMISASQVTRAANIGPLDAGMSMTSIPPIVDGSVRDGLDYPKDGIPDYILENSVVQVLNVDRSWGSFEDRGIIEFDISSLGHPVSNVVLQLTAFGSHGPFPIIIDVYAYAGDGTLTLEDFNAGRLVTSFQYSGEATITLDVTSVIQEMVAARVHFAGFNFRSPVPSTIEMNGPFVAFNSLEYPPAAHLDLVMMFVVPVDIRPQSCPNPLNVKSQGVLPVAILGTATFNVTQVDPASIKLGGVSPLRWALEDVGTPFVPFTGKKKAADCTTAGSDGFKDLTLKFDTQSVVVALGPVTDGQVRVLKLTGKLKPQFGSIPIVGEDVVVILKK